MSDSYDDYEAKLQLAEQAWEKRVVKTEHDRAVELGKAYERGWNAALAQQEPFEYWNAVEGWVKIDEVREHFNAVGCGTIYKSAGEGRSPLYTAPPKKEWVGLTDEEIEYIADSEWEEAFVRMIEAKLREKNT